MQLFRHLQTKLTEWDGLQRDAIISNLTAVNKLVIKLQLWAQSHTHAGVNRMLILSSDAC